MPQNFPNGGALAPADGHGPHRLGVGEESGLDEDLVIDALVVLAGLDAAVQDQDLAVRVGLEDLHELELGLARGDGAGDGVHVAFDGSGGLEEPLVLRRTRHLAADDRLADGVGRLVGHGDGAEEDAALSSTTEARAAPSSATRWSAAA